MTTPQARLVGDTDDLGEVPEAGLVVFGQTITREWSDVEFTERDLPKVKANRFIELRGAGTKDAPSEKPEAAKGR